MRSSSTGLTCPPAVCGRRTGILHEVKKSDKMEEAHAWQVLYYLWYLKQKGVGGLKGEIDYPKLKQKTSVELTPQREEELTRILSDIGPVQPHVALFLVAARNSPLKQPGTRQLAD
jgi:hypothetical protein